MQLHAQARLTFPREVVFRAYRDLIYDVVPFLPNIASIVVQERKDAGPVVDMVNLWTGKTELPAMARRFLKADMFCWTDVAHWDETVWKCQWRLRTHAFPEVMECSGRTEYFEDGAGTSIEISGDLALRLDKAPVPRLLAGTLQPLLERIIIGQIKPNLVSTGDAVQRYLVSRKPA